MQHIPLYSLSKSNYGSISNIKTFTTFCKESTVLPTNEWLIPETHKQSMLTHILTAYMDGMEFIVKVQPYSKSSEQEMSIYEEIDAIKHPNFAELVCHFTCKDNIIVYNKQSSLPPGFCQDGATKIHLTIMPYYNLGAIVDQPIELENIWPIIAQVVFGYIEMFNLIGFTHNDLIPNNVVIDDTSYNHIEYIVNDVTYRVQTNGYRAIILDFGVSSKSKNESFVVRDLMLFITKLLRSNYPDILMKDLVSKQPKTINDIIELMIDLKAVSVI